MAKEAVTQGGKEELRASLLKTYFLRLRAEKGEAAIEQLLTSAGISAAVANNETAWLSMGSASRALRRVRDELGRDALKKRGEWSTHPEALGTWVRMLRGAEQPVDAYRYLADNSREMTRVGAWQLEEIGLHKTALDSASKALIRSVRMTYEPKLEAYEDEKIDRKSEELFCDVREGELAAFPRMWGLPDATVTHEKCLAKGHDACVYLLEWNPIAPPKASVFFGIICAVLAGGILSVASGPVAGGLGAALAGALGAIIGQQWSRSKVDGVVRAFEKNRIAALERGLELKGDVSSTSGELTGTVLGGKYRIGKKIGSGGIGVVYVAEHTSLGHEVAVKVLRGAAARDGGEIARLRREAYVQVHIEHPNIARVLDLDQMPDGSMYVVMERLLGRSLADKLSREHVVTPGFALPIFIEVCRALEAAHKKGVVHRDLKPGNIFLCDDGSAKVLDFGMSKLASAESLTQAGYTLGTPEYMAPEQCIGGNVEPRTDIYAFGVLMYEALTGELPIVAPSRRELLDMHQRQIPKPMRERRPELNIPSELDVVVMQCLKKKIRERPESAAQLESMLAAIPREGLPLAYPSIRPPVSNAPRSVNPDQGTLASLPSDRPPEEPK